MAWKPKKSFNYLTFIFIKTYCVPGTVLGTRDTNEQGRGAYNTDVQADQLERARGRWVYDLWRAE